MATNGDGRFDLRAQARAASSLVSVAIVVLVLGAVYSSFAVIKPGNVGVVFNRWSGSLRAAGQGVVWRIPWITQVQSYPIALRTYSMVARSGEGSALGDDSIDLPTREGQHIRQDISVTYNTSEDKAANVFRSFRGADIEDIEASFVRRTIITVSQNAAGQMALTDLISNQRTTLQDAIQEQLGTQMEKMGFVVDKVNLGASHLPQAIEAQMQQKMAAQQQAQQAEYELQRQQTLRQGESRRGRRRRASDARQGQGASRGEPAAPGDLEPVARPVEGDRPLERHPSAVLGKRDGPVREPDPRPDAQSLTIYVTPHFAATAGSPSRHTDSCRFSMHGAS